MAFMSTGDDFLIPITKGRFGEASERRKAQWRWI